MRWIHQIILVGALAGCVGCSSHHEPEVTSNQKLNQWMELQDPLLPPIDYKLQSPDTILITAPNMKELDGQRATIRPDGRITLNLLGEVFVADKTPDQVARQLRKLAMKFYAADMVELSVQVVEYKSKVVYVFGQVDEPGIKPFTGRDTVLNVLAAARLNNQAWPQKVVIVRPNEEVSVRQKVTVDLKRMWETGELEQNYMLEEGDMVYVPPSPLAQINFTFEKLLTPFEPSMSLVLLATRGVP
jgi:polysaccharide export outer membrane protein